MKIGMLIPEFPGQTHSFFWREIVELRRRHGIETAILSTRLPPRPVMHEWVKETRPRYLYPVSAARMAGLVIKLIPRLPRILSDRAVRRLLREPRNWGLMLMAVRLAELCRDEAIAHLHVHSCANAALIAAFCNRLYGLPYSLTLHGPIEDYGPHQDVKWRHAAFVFVITEKLRREVADVLPDVMDKVTVVPMGVDTDRFVPPNTPRPDTPETFRWFCCARLNRVKGFDTLVEAAARLRTSHPDRVFTVTVAGEDEQGGTGYRLDIEADIAARGLGDTVILRGALSQAEVLQELQSSGGFVLASRHEPLGVAYMEAMACGLPTVGTRAGGVEELIDDGTDGLLVPPGDATALEAAMAGIMADSARRRALGERAREKVVTRFGANRSADALARELRQASLS